MKKKRTIIMTASIFALIAIIFGTIVYFKSPVAVGGTVKIGDNEFTNEDIVFYHHDARIPILQTLVTLGFDIDWTSDTTAVLSKEDLQFNVELSTPALENNSKNHNLLLPPAGYNSTQLYCERIGKDIFMKASDFALVLEAQLETEFDIDIDIKTKSVEFQIG